MRGLWLHDQGAAVTSGTVPGTERLKPGAHQVRALDKLFDEVVPWGEALVLLRQVAKIA